MYVRLCVCASAHVCVCVFVCVAVCIPSGWFHDSADGFGSVCNVIWDSEISLFQDLC